MTITTRIYTALCGRHIGTDQFGNRYYERRGAAHGSPTDARKHVKRWVMYKGKAEASKVPAEWHGWLHYTRELPPTEQRMPHHMWEKPPLPNLTGTPGAYVPPGHLRRGARRDATTADYEPWKP